MTNHKTNNDISELRSAARDVMCLRVYDLSLACTIGRLGEGTLLLLLSRMRFLFAVIAFVSDHVRYCAE